MAIYLNKCEYFLSILWSEDTSFKITHPATDAEDVLVPNTWYWENRINNPKFPSDVLTTDAIIHNKHRSGLSMTTGMMEKIGFRKIMAGWKYHDLTTHTPYPSYTYTVIQLLYWHTLETSQMIFLTKMKQKSQKWFGDYSVPY